MKICTVCNRPFVLGWYILDNDDVQFCSEKHRKKWRLQKFTGVSR